MSSLDKHLKKGRKKQQLKWAGPRTENQMWKFRQLAREKQRKLKLQQQKKIWTGEEKNNDWCNYWRRSGFQV